MVKERSTAEARWRIALLTLVVIALAIGGRSLASHLASITSGIERLGTLGAVLFIAGFAMASVVFVPAGLLTLMAGALFGLAAGTVYAFLGASLGACMAFLIARYVARSMVERWLAGNPRVAMFSGAIGARGRRIVALMRLSPVIPFSVINLAMGVTRIRFVDFVVANLAMLPVTVLYVYYGTVAGAVLNVGRGHPHGGTLYYAALVLGLVATIAVTTIVGRLAAAALANDARIAG